MKFFASLLFKVDYETRFLVYPTYYLIFVFCLLNYFEICSFCKKNCISWYGTFILTKRLLSFFTVCQMRRSYGIEHYY